MEIVQTKAKVINDSSGIDVELPVLLTPDGVLEPLVDYLLSRTHSRSRSWMKKVVLSTKLFLQYGAANANLLAQSPALAFQQFAQRLTTGTIGVKLLQVCSGSMYTQVGSAEYIELHDEKLDALESILEELGGEQLLVVFEQRNAD